MTLQWRKPDDFHIRSECGRFTVSKMTVLDRLWYVAFRRDEGQNGVRSIELGATAMPIDALDGERSKAIGELKQLCEAAE